MGEEAEEQNRITCLGVGGDGRGAARGTRRGERERSTCRDMLTDFLDLFYGGLGASFRG